MNNPQAPIRRRLVMYFSGFDPAGPAKYHQLYTEQAALAAPLLGAHIEVGSRKNLAAQHQALWPLRYTPDDGSETVETDYVFARWDDIIRQHWLRTDTWAQRWQFAKAFFKAHALFIGSGAMLQMARLSRPPVLALMAPLIAALVGLVLLFFTCLFSLHSLFSLFFEGKRLIAGINTAQAAIIFILITVLWFAVVRQLEKRWHMMWLMRSYIFTRLQALGETPHLDERLQSMAHSIRQHAASGQYDEILIVGHSSGSMMANIALSQAMPLEPSQTRISLLTLGHWWPLLSYLPSAQAQRDQLKHLAMQAGLTWVDVSAAADGCCFAFIDPMRTLPASSTLVCRPHLVSTRWHTLFDDQAYKRLRKDRFRFHFQYIFATPKLGACDFFAITAGPLSLAQRFTKVPAAV
jgi:transposase